MPIECPLQLQVFRLSSFESWTIFTKINPMTLHFKTKGIVLFCILYCFVFAPGCKESTTLPSSDTFANKNNVSRDIDAEVVFADVTSEMHLAHQYKNGEEQDEFTYLEAMGGGLAVLDFDRDGWPDLFFPGGGNITKTKTITPLPGTLWRNGFGKDFANVSHPSRCDNAKYYSQGASSGDINNDGFPDLLVTGYGGLQLFLNQGDGTFLELADSSGLEDAHWSTSAGFGDFDSDGSLDLYVANYVDWSWEKNPECKSSSGVREICPPGAFKGQQDFIFMSNGDGSFRSVTSEAGLVAEGKGLGVVCADFNQDSKLDVYVANDAVNNFLYVNQGNGRFDEQGIASGTALDERGTSNGSMGVAVLDFNGDLRPDIWVCNYENETFALYKNDGNSNFRHVTSSTGITALGTLFVAFGTVAADFDCDGDEDIVVANGHVLRFPKGNSVEQFPLLLRNNGRGKLARQQFEPSSYFGKKWRGRGVSNFDFDRDGDMDLVFSNVNQPCAILENRTKTKGNWCSLELVGTKSNRDCIGSRIVFRTDKRSYLRNIIGGGSYLTQNPYLVHVAFPPDEELQQAEITWPDGIVQLVTNLVVNEFNQLVEPCVARTAISR